MTPKEENEIFWRLQRLYENGWDIRFNGEYWVLSYPKKIKQDLGIANSTAFRCRSVAEAFAYKEGLEDALRALGRLHD